MSKPFVVVSCPIDTFSGYGARSRDVVKALINSEKYDVKILSQRWGNTPYGFLKEDNEDEKKFLKIYKIVVNNQHILPHTSMITPIQNEYIKNLLSTEEGTKFYRKKIFNPGHHHGWYGTYSFRFLIDQMQMEDQRHVELIESTGITPTHITTDPNRIKYYKKADKK